MSGLIWKDLLVLRRSVRVYLLLVVFYALMAVTGVWDESVFGGISALLGTHDCREIERRIQAGDERAALVYKAQALQIAKGVGTLLGCFTELIDAVILTGGLAYSKMLTDMVIGYLHNLARVVVIPGENEMEALALGGLRLLRGEEPVHTFAPACDLSVIP